ncbi:MAG: VWA domain-containing protein [Chloroflexia bacterium]
MSLFFTQPALLLLLLLLPAIYVVGTRDRLRTRRLWVITGLRLAAVASLVLSLAGPTLVTPRRDLAVVFLVDVSDSLGAGGKRSARDFVRQAYEGAGGRDRVGLIVFGKGPRVERDVAAASPLGDLLSRPDATATDIPSAIRLALALFPDGAQKRIVLVSDGANNVGDLEDAGRLAASAGVQIQTRTLGGVRGADVVVDSVQAPLRVRVGESFELQVGVDSSIASTGRLEVFGDGRLIAQREVQVKSGRNEYIVAVPEQARGFHRWQARVLVGGDTVAQNNQAEGFTYVEAPPRVLIAEAEAGEGRNLHAALRATGLDAVLMNVSNIPASLTALSEYSAVVLVDVPLTALPDEGRILQTYVRDLGKGLITVGGEESYALGGYFNSPLEATLPVDSRLKNKQNEPLVAMVMALDKSGSMASCHCGGGDEFQDPPGSIPKVDTAKEATIQSAQLLGPGDEFGVVAFDTAARWVVRTAPIGDGTAAAEQVAGIQAAGGTNIYGGLAEAVESLKSSKASVKHVVLLTDGWSNVGNYDKLIADARASGITISTIAAGGGSPELLKSIAEKGAGAFYVSENNADIPKILLRETQRKLRRYIQEVEFTPTITAPSPVLKDLRAVPSLLGYVGTTAKPGATVALSSPEREPVLAQWQYGLGRSASWTSDAKSRWSANWIGTPEYARLWSQAVGWVLARPSENVQVSVTQEEARRSSRWTRCGRTALTSTVRMRRSRWSRRAARLLNNH